MSTLVIEEEPIAVKVKITMKKLSVDLSDGRSIVVPLSWYLRLSYGSSKERQNWRLLGNGNAIEWPDLDLSINTEALLVGKRSGETEKSFKSWLASRKQSHASIEDGNGSQPSVDQNIEFDAAKQVYQARERYAVLIDTKFQQGLTRKEQLELKTLEKLLDDAERPFYEPVIQRLTTAKNS